MIKMRPLINRQMMVGLILVSTIIPSSYVGSAARRDSLEPHTKIERALIFSIDGARAKDIEVFISAHPKSALAMLAQRGTRYLNATVPVSDSVPGLVALFTGATPRLSGIPYIPWFDRALSPANSDCSVTGVSVSISDKLNINPDAEDGGNALAVSKLPRDRLRNCAPVWPHQMLKVNSLFTLVKRAGGRTAWVDQHLAYVDLLSGTNGTDLDDWFAPDGSVARRMNSFDALTRQDDRRVEAVLNQISGLTHDNKQMGGVPTIFGMSFITFNAEQKSGGYDDYQEQRQSKLERAIKFIDHRIGIVIDSLKTKNLLSSTIIIITSKHGQSATDKKQRLILNKEIIGNIISDAGGATVQQVTQDRSIYVWLSDNSKVQKIKSEILTRSPKGVIASMFSNQRVKDLMGRDQLHGRSPNIIVNLADGVIPGAPNDARTAEHGGFSRDDVSVPLILSVFSGSQRISSQKVSLTQLSPTIATLLGLPVQKLDAVRLGRVEVLPQYARH